MHKFLSRLGLVKSRSLSAPERKNQSDYSKHPEYFAYDKEFVKCNAQFIRGQLIHPLNLLPAEKFKELIRTESVRGYIYGYISIALNDDESILPSYEHRMHEIIASYYNSVFDVEGYNYRVKTLEILDSNEFKNGLNLACADYYKNKSSGVWQCRNLERIIFLMLSTEELNAICKKMGVTTKDYLRMDTK